MDVLRSREKFERLLAGKECYSVEQLKTSPDGDDDSLLSSMMRWHEDITYALCSHVDELCLQHSIRLGYTKQELSPTCPPIPESAAHVKAPALKLLRRDFHKDGKDHEEDGEGDGGKVHPDVKAAVVAEASSSGFLRAFLALVEEGHALVQRTRDDQGRKGLKTAEEEEEDEEGWSKDEWVLPLLDMFGTIHRLTGRAEEWVGGSDDASMQRWEQLEKAVAAAAMGALQATRDDVMGEIAAVTSECQQLAGVSEGFKQAERLCQQYAGAESMGPSTGVDALTHYVVDGILKYCSWDAKRTVLAAFSSSFTSRSFGGRLVSPRCLSTVTNTTRPSLLLPASSAYQLSHSPSSSGGSSRRTSLSEKPEKPEVHVNLFAALSRNFSIVDAPEEGDDYDYSGDGCDGDDSATHEPLAGVEEEAEAEAGAAGVPAYDDGNGTAGCLWSYAQLLDIIFECHPDTFPEWQDLAVEMVEGLWAAVQAKAPLMAAAVAEEGAGEEGMTRKREERKARKRDFLFGLGKKAVTQAPVSVEEILEKLYLFNNAAYIQKLVHGLRLSKEFRQLSETYMHAFLDMLLRDIMAAIGPCSSPISAAEFKKRLLAFNHAFDELGFHMRWYDVQDAVTRAQIKSECHDRILSTYEEFLEPFSENLLRHDEYRWTEESMKRVMNNFFIGSS